MKKYLIAAAVAVIAFAMAASASQLNLDGGIQQAGQDVTLYCSTGAEVSYANLTNGDGEFTIDSITVTFDDDGCDGMYANIATFSDNPQDPGGASQTGFAVGQISGDSVTYDVDESLQAAEAKNLEAVSVLVKNTDDGPFTSGIFN